MSFKIRINRIILVVFLLFSINVIFSQNSYQRVSHEMNEIFKDYKNFSLDVVLNHDFKSDYKVIKKDTKLIFDRNLDFGYHNKRMLITINNYGQAPSDRANNFGYIVDLVVKNDSIIAFLNLKNYAPDSQIYYDEVKVQRYVNLHDKFYQTKTTVKDFISSFEKQTTYGFFCGYSPIDYGVPTHEGLFFDKAENRKTFFDWLKSYDLGLQANGVTALEFLRDNKKVVLTGEENRIINSIRTRNTIINVCSGCTSEYSKLYKETPIKRK
ncbi:hypothetical protein [Flavobacterium terrisoli]|uniref:hypothetical protein n=1 Tax=Flavobacterium terrisoli TaxID=3242195 RepID=UPI00254367E4|nr:hypothetical protein [Flavobacterium buctense]